MRISDINSNVIVFKRCNHISIFLLSTAFLVTPLNLLSINLDHVLSITTFKEEQTVLMMLFLEKQSHPEFLWIWRYKYNNQINMLIFPLKLCLLNCTINHVSFHWHCSRKLLHICVPLPLRTVTYIISTNDYV